MTIYFNSGVKEVFDGYADLNVRGDVTRVPAELLFLKLGADPPRKFFESVGIRYTGDGKDARPILTPVHQSSVPGLFLIGAASGRDLIKLGMNQGWEVVEHLMGREVEPADEAVLKERLPFWEGSVRERIASIRSRVPLLPRPTSNSCARRSWPRACASMRTARRSSARTITRTTSS